MFDATNVRNGGKRRLVFAIVGLGELPALYPSVAPKSLLFDLAVTGNWRPN
jgi:hypothetical protein